MKRLSPKAIKTLLFKRIVRVVDILLKQNFGRSFRSDFFIRSRRMATQDDRKLDPMRCVHFGHRFPGYPQSQQLGDEIGKGAILFERTHFDLAYQFVW